MMMKIKCRGLLWASSFLACALAASGSVAAADGPRYTYGEVGYLNLDFDEVNGVGADGDGWTINGSAAVTDMVHLVAGYTDADIDVDDFGFGEISADYSQIVAGLGVNFAVADTVDLVGRIAYVRAEVDIDGFGDADDDGYALQAGVRAMVLPPLELNGGITYSDLGGDDGSETSVGIGAVYNFTDIFAVTAGASFGDDTQTIGLGVRLYFGAT
jgi:hypothetical protein